MFLGNYIEALEFQEDFLLERLLDYASAAEYTRYKSTNEDDWRVTIRKFAKALVDYLENYPPPETIHVDERFAKDPAVSFAILEARRHRKRGVRFDMFLGFSKLMRQAFIDLVYETDLADEERKRALELTHRFFDKLELGFCSDWISNRETDLIRELQEKNRELTNEKNRYQIIFNSMIEPAFVVDPEMKFLEVNPAFEQFFGLSRKEVTGRTWGDTLKCEPCRTFPLAEADDEQGRIRRMEKVIEVKGEPRTVIFKGGALNDISRKFMGGVVLVQDITHRKFRETELMKVEKLESIGVLAGGIAHDFNNILTAVMGNITLAKMNIEPNAETYAILNEAEDATKRAKYLTNQLITFAKGGAPHKEPADLSQTLRDAVKFALSGSNVSAEFSLPDDISTVEADKSQIRQVIHNIVRNSRDAMPKGGAITISADNVALSSENPLNLPEGAYVRITLSDNGPGIADEILSKIFDPYFTTKKKGSEKGTGLGLAICYSIIRKHGGIITAESSHEAGASFNIYLPAIEAYRHDRAAEAGEGASAAANGRILLMDDEEIVRTVASRILIKHDYIVETAGDGDEAVALYRKALESGNPFDAVILDLTIPGGKGGNEALQQLVEIDPEVKAIVSSGYADDRIINKYREFGFSGVLRKPYSSRELIRALWNICRKTSD